MSAHMWVALSMTPIEITEQPDGELHTYTTEMGDEIAREDSKLCCWNCGDPLTTESYHSECTAQSSRINS